MNPSKKAWGGAGRGSSYLLDLLGGYAGGRRRRRHGHLLLHRRGLPETRAYLCFPACFSVAPELVKEGGLAVVVVLGGRGGVHGYRQQRRGLGSSKRLTMEERAS